MSKLVPSQDYALYSLQKCVHWFWLFRFIRSVQDLLRVEEQDQTQWARRRHRTTNTAIALSSMTPGNNTKITGLKPSHPTTCDAKYRQQPGRRKPVVSPSEEAELRASQGSKLLYVETSIATSPKKKVQREGITTKRIKARRGRQPSSSCLPHAVNPSPLGRNTEPPLRKYTKNVSNEGTSMRISTARLRQEQRIGDKTQQRQGKGLDLTQAMEKLIQLRTSLVGAMPSECHDIALEMASLYLVLSDPTSALKNFQIALKPSPGEFVPSLCRTSYYHKRKWTARRSATSKQCFTYRSSILLSIAQSLRFLCVVRQSNASPQKLRPSR